MEEKLKSSLQGNFILKLENKCKDFEIISLSRPIYDADKKDLLRFLKSLCNDVIESINE